MLILLALPAAFAAGSALFAATGAVAAKMDERRAKELCAQAKNRHALGVPVPPEGQRALWESNGLVEDTSLFGESVLLTGGEWLAIQQALAAGEEGEDRAFALMGAVLADQQRRRQLAGAVAA